MPKVNIPMYDVADPQLAALAWSRLVEPGDVVAGALVGALGASEALRWLYQWNSQGAPSGAISADAKTGSLARLESAAASWSTRLAGLDPVQDLRNGHRVGAQLLIPGDPNWPPQLSALGAATPFALWVRGDPELLPQAQRSVALVGSRTSTSYGETTATELAVGLSERGFVIISGGAYGVDAAAHRGALAANGPTLAILANGIDRMYPTGNTALLRAIANGGALVSELPPGATPYRSRFLARNRLIAALANATVVVEAAWRSGALSTARHAASLLRPLGAVPGPITSMASGGCHQLIRDGLAVLVTDAAEVAELASANGDDVAAEPVGNPIETDGLTAEQKQVYGVLALQKYLSPVRLSELAGLALPQVLSALGILELRALAQTNGTSWRCSRSKQ